MGFQKHTPEERNKGRNEALTRIKHLDDLADVRSLEKDAQEWRCRVASCRRGP